MEVTADVCSDVAGGSMLLMTTIVGICGDISGVDVLSVTAIVGRGAGGAYLVKFLMTAPPAGAVLFAYGGVGMATERVKIANNIWMNRRHIVGERLLERLASMSE